MTLLDVPSGMTFIEDGMLIKSRVDDEDDVDDALSDLELGLEADAIEGAEPRPSGPTRCV